MSNKQQQHSMSLSKKAIAPHLTLDVLRQFVYVDDQILYCDLLLDLVKSFNLTISFFLFFFSPSENISLDCVFFIFFLKKRIQIIHFVVICISFFFFLFKPYVD